MKLSERNSSIIAETIVIAATLALLIPAIMLGIYGEMPLLAIVAGLMFQGGLLLMFMTLRGRVGLNALLLLPLIILAGFQIVLLFLYSDGSIIGIDMFLNVVTTNPGEVSELLINLKSAILTVLALYLPIVIAALYAILKKVRLKPRAVSSIRRIGFYCFGFGAYLLLICKACLPGYMFDEHLYPCNVFYNMAIAVKRTIDVSNYHRTSAGYTYEASSTRPDNEREIYVAVIGETSRADNWQLCGYSRPTNPQLSNRACERLSVYPRVLSESNTTHKSVPLLLSPLSSYNYDSEINKTKSIITAFHEAGFHTAYLTMQVHNGSYIDFFANEADEVHFIRDPKGQEEFSGCYDIDLLQPLDSILKCDAPKQLIVLHCYGSHFNYRDRYPDEDSCFKPDNVTDAKAANRSILINAYDNTIVHTDRLLAGVIDRLDSIGCPGAMIYTSDHGEDIFDDSRNRFLHASPTPTFHQLHVPLLIYMNEIWADAHREMHQTVMSHTGYAISSSEAYAPTLIHMAGVSTPKIDYNLSIASENLVPVTSPCFLSDRNEALSLKDSGFRRQDFDRFNAM